jgi:tRNA1Val (adenine37-N6)-methyltransferase
MRAAAPAAAAGAPDEPSSTGAEQLPEPEPEPEIAAKQHPPTLAPPRDTVCPPSHFKGWCKPGPLPPGLASGVTLQPGETLDAVCGHFWIFQLRDGHRFSTDDVLVAWYGTSWCPTARRALDLGSGIGTVATVVAWRLPGAQMTTVEAQSASVALARKSVLYNGIDARTDIRLGDFREPGVVRSSETFDLVTGSPPYFPNPAVEKWESKHPQKQACRFELRGTVADYCAAAARHLAPGGLFACVFPHEPAQRARVESGAQAAGLVIVRRRPVVFREGDEALIALFAMMRASDLPEWFREQETWVEPALVIRRRDGGVHPEYSAVKLAIGLSP